MVLAKCRIPGKDGGCLAPLPFTLSWCSMELCIDGVGLWLCGCSATSFSDVNPSDMRLNLKEEGKETMVGNPMEAKPKQSRSLAVFWFPQ